MAVLVLDRSGKPLMPCSEKRARLLLERGRARVHRVVPMVIRLVDRQVADCTLQPVRVKLDPGSKTTGLALVRDAERIDVTTGSRCPKPDGAGAPWASDFRSIECAQPYAQVSSRQLALPSP